MPKKKPPIRDIRHGTVSGYTLKYLPKTVKKLRSGTLTQDPKLVVALEVRPKTEDGQTHKLISVQCPIWERDMSKAEPSQELFRELGDEVGKKYPVNSVCPYTEEERIFRNKDGERVTAMQYFLAE